MANLTYEQRLAISIHELIEAETLREAILSANDKGVNAAFLEDEQAFYDNLEIVSSPDNKQKVVN